MKFLYACLMDCRLLKLKETNPGETLACIKLKLGKKYWAAYFGASFNSFIQQKCGLCPNPTLQMWSWCLKSLNGFKNVLIFINFKQNNSVYIGKGWPEYVPLFEDKIYCLANSKTLYLAFLRYYIHSWLLHLPILLKK